MTWVKAEVVKGNWVTLGVIGPGGEGPYSHIINVVGVNSNKPATSTAYDGTDVLIIEDHGAETVDGDNPAVPPGAGTTSGCTPYMQVLGRAALHGSVCRAETSASVQGGPLAQQPGPTRPLGSCSLRRPLCARTPAGLPTLLTA
jgi:hypothetical protein